MFTRQRQFPLTMASATVEFSSPDHPSGSGSTRPEVKSAPESSRPWVNLAWYIVTYIYMYNTVWVLHNLSDKIKDKY